jgi:hypothetical protein
VRVLKRDAFRWDSEESVYCSLFIRIEKWSVVKYCIVLYWQNRARKKYGVFEKRDVKTNLWWDERYYYETKPSKSLALPS